MDHYRRFSCCMAAVQISNNKAHIAEVIARRHANPFVPPPTWSIEDFRKLGGNKLFAPPFDKAVTVSGLGTFNGLPTSVKLTRSHNPKMPFQTFNVPGMSLKEAKTTAPEVQKHNIRIGSAQITEHPLAFFTGLNVGGAWEFSTTDFPGSPEVMRELAKKFAAVCEPVQVVNTKTMMGGVTDRTLEYVASRNEVLFTFPHGAYVIYKPPGAKQDATKLTIDLQFSHKNVLGTQRIIAEITPEFFGYIAAARSPSYGPLGFFLENISRIRGREHPLPFTGLFRDNFVVIGKKQIRNADSRFNDSSGINREALCHEVIDKLGAIALLGLQRKLVGTLIFSRTSHAKDVIVMQRLESMLVPLQHL